MDDAQPMPPDALSDLGELARHTADGRTSGYRIVLGAAEQLALWNALKEVPVLTEAQVRLGALMRAGRESDHRPCEPEEQR